MLLLRKTWLWGLLYLGSIVGFAWFYGWMGIPLAQSTTLQDKTYQAAAEEFETALEDSLNGALEDNFSVNCEFVSAEGREISILLAIIEEVPPEPGWYHYEKVVQGFLHAKFLQFPPYLNADATGPSREMEINVISFGDFVRRHPEYGVVQEGFEIEFGNDPWEEVEPRFRSALTSKGGLFDIDDELLSGQPRPLFDISFYNTDEVADAAYRVLNEADGTLDSSQSFVRMLYFSSATATTLGYGDIVPLDDDGRALVTAQTLLSVVLIGIFLNSIALRAGKSPGSVSKERKEEDKA